MRRRGRRCAGGPACVELYVWCSHLWRAGEACSGAGRVQDPTLAKRMGHAVTLEALAYETQARKSKDAPYRSM